MELVEKDTARLTEASREGSEQRKRPTRKILVHEEGVYTYRVPCALFGDEDGNEEERRENKKNGASQSTFPSRGARVSIGALILAGEPRTGAS